MTNSGEGGRLHALDGLRGLAAISVVLTHYLATFFPFSVFGANGVAGHEMQDTLSRSPLFAVYSGSYAVFIFFVLSGFVIAKSASSTTVPLTLLVGRRYARLTVPVLASTVLAYFLLGMFPDVAQVFAKQSNNGWLAGFYGHALSLKQAIFDAVFNPYRFGESFSNRVLWTMQTELFGSLSIYVLYRLVPRHFMPITLGMLLLLLVPQDSFLVKFMGFAGGALIYEAMTKGVLPRGNIFGVVLVSVGFLLGGLPSQPAENTHFGPIESFVENFSSPFEFILGMAAILTVTGCVSWARAMRFLAFKWLRFLGRISFAVYLIHWPILATVFIGIHLEMGQSVSGFALLSIAYFVILIGLSYLFTVFIDEPVTNLLRWAKTHPRTFNIYLVHFAALLLSLFFVSSRLGPDFGALLVWAIAYVGLLVAIPLALHGWLYKNMSLKASKA